MSLILSGTDGLSDVDGSAATPAIRGTDANTGIFFPAADTIAFAEGGVEAMRLDASGNLGLGVTPSAWASSMKAIQIGTLSSLHQNDSGSFYTSRNSYNSSTGYRYLSTDTAQLFGPQSNGVFAWYNAPSGTAGNVITWTQAMTLNSSGDLLVGVTSNSFNGLTVAKASATYLSVYGNTSNDGGLLLGGGGTENKANVIYKPSLDALQIASNAAGSYIYLSTGGTERARIDSSGNFLWNKTTASSSNTGINFENDGTNVARLNIGGASSASGTGLSLYSTTAGAFRFFVSYSGTINATSTSITAISDQSLKENIRDLDTGLSEVMALRPRRFDWKEETQLPDRNVAGFIAQEVSQVLPELVYDYMYSEGVTKKSLKMGDMLPTLVKAMQEQQAIIESQSVAIQALTQRITALEGA